MEQNKEAQLTDRPEITRQQFFHAATYLQVHGKPVTIAGVRKALGVTGSFMRCSVYIAEWKKEEAQKLRSRIEEIPDEVTQAVLPHVWSIWQELQAVANRNRQAEKKEADKLYMHCRHVEADLAAAENEVSDLEEENRLLTEEIEQLKKANAALKEKQAVKVAEAGEAGDKERVEA